MLIFENLFPLADGVTLTDEAFMELCVGIFIYAAGTAIIFYAGASSGGMDIMALIIQKYAKVDVGRAVLFVNFFIACGSLFVFPLRVNIKLRGSTFYHTQCI
jgi:uncharacterized membrane-anchored protein YitT (DUF2179 family)